MCKTSFVCVWPVLVRARGRALVLGHGWPNADQANAAQERQEAPFAEESERKGVGVCV